jgi:DNA mismatch repair ATPase MutS
MVPYERIHTYLNIPDTSGRDSLFQAESRRCKEIVDIIRTSPHQRHFCIFDELFSGTNPVEATKAGYALLAYISKFKTVDFILTTHYTEICDRFRKSKRVRNFKMKTLIDKKTDKLTYTYKIRRGISKVQGAIDVLKEMEFPYEIIKMVKNFQ